MKHTEKSETRFYVNICGIIDQLQLDMTNTLTFKTWYHCSPENLSLEWEAGRKQNVYLQHLNRSQRTRIYHQDAELYQIRWFHLNWTYFFMCNHSSVKYSHGIWQGCLFSSRREISLDVASYKCHVRGFCDHISPGHRHEHSCCTLHLVFSMDLFLYISVVWASLYAMVVEISQSKPCKSAWHPCT
jgi:hypothetical protein